MVYRLHFLHVLFHRTLCSHTLFIILTQVGDQILDVNNRSFLDIDHQEAVNILKSCKLMMMTVKDVGKLPYARTTIDRTQWIMGDDISVLGNDISRSNSRMTNGSMHNGDVTLERRPRSSAVSKIARNTLNFALSSMTWKPRVVQFEFAKVHASTVWKLDPYRSNFSPPLPKLRDPFLYHG